VKISRDITIGSKRLIFLLHRISNESEEEIQQQASESLKGVRENIVRVIDELGTEPYYRYQRAFSPGLQEYIEAASFLHYLLTRSLITPQQLLQDVLDLLPNKVIQESLYCGVLVCHSNMTGADRCQFLLFTAWLSLGHRWFDWRVDEGVCVCVCDSCHFFEHWLTRVILSIAWIL